MECVSYDEKGSGSFVEEDVADSPAQPAEETTDILADQLSPTPISAPSRGKPKKNYVRIRKDYIEYHW